MRTLTGSSIPNIDSSDLANYPYARFKNDSTPTSADGTELSERTLGDLYQAAIELLRRAGITPSETAEKKADSDIADAVGFLKPVAIVRIGYNLISGSAKVMGGSYTEGYSATFEESTTSGTDTVFCKLGILKNSVAVTDDLLVTITPALSNLITVMAKHGAEGFFPNNGYSFRNNVANNIVFYESGGGAIADVRAKAQAIVTVWKM